MVERDIFLMKQKHQYHLSDCVKGIYGAQSTNKRRLWCESVLISIEKWILILKMAEREVFPMKPEHQFICPSVENEFVEPNH